MAKTILKYAKNRIGSVLVALIFSIAYLNLFVFSATFQAQIEIDSSGKADFKVYWAEHDKGYSESNSSRIRLRNGINGLKLYIGDLDNISKLRIDPIDREGTVKMYSASVRQSAMQTITMEPSRLSEAVTNDHIESLDLHDKYLKVVLNSYDGYLEFTIDPVKIGIPFVHYFLAALIFIGLVILIELFSLLIQRDYYLAGCLFVALLLSIIMATVTGDGIHPDESIHISATQYYKSHWLPPALDDPEIHHTFSPYGKSRLSTYEIYYPVVGYFSRLFDSFQLPAYAAPRIFSLGLLFIMFVVAVRNMDFRCMTLPLIISPQVWYLFSYANSDALALTAGMVMAYQVAADKSGFNNLLNKPLGKVKPWPYLFFGALLAIVLFTKQNNYFLMIFVFFYIVWRQVNGKYIHGKQLWIRLIIIGVVALSAYSARYAWDYVQNGPDPKARFNEYIELKARYEFKPSTPIEEKFAYIHIKEKGFDLDFIINQLSWFDITFATSFGSYGFTEFNGTDVFYTLVKVFLGLFMACLIYYVLVYGSPSLQILLLLAAAVSASLILVSLFVSWRDDFQAQGRYLAPILPIISILYFHLRKILDQRVFAAITLALFGLSVYSFLFFGLEQIMNTKVVLGGRL